MIQRLQSVFLLLAAAMMALLFAKPLSFLAIDQVPESGREGMLADGLFEIQDHTLLAVMTGIIIVLTVAAIFLYKNRVLQIKIGWATVVLIIITCITSVIFFWQAYQGLAGPAQVNIKLGYAMPVLAIIFLILAIQYIGKDEKLVRSADRLR
jgi:hypothetical protein